MTINDPDGYLAGIWDWAMFDGCWGKTRIRPMDIDGLIERNGKFLVLEAKQSGVDIVEGEKITFDTFAKRGDTVLVMWGKKNKPRKALLITRKGEFEINPADVDKCRLVAAAWFEYADGRQFHSILRLMEMLRS